MPFALMVLVAEHLTASPHVIAPCQTPSLAAAGTP